jgi:nuclear transport factor 2 (NTF2) superfamily protein
MKLALHQKDRSYEPMKNLNSRNTSKPRRNRNRGESYSASASTVLCWQTQELKFLNSKNFKEVTYRIVKEQNFFRPNRSTRTSPGKLRNLGE